MTIILNFFSGISNNTDSQSIPSISQKPLWKRALILFCGLESNENEPKISEEEMNRLQAEMTNIEEEKWPAIYVNIAGIAMCCAGVFLFGFYA